MYVLIEVHGEVKKYVYCIFFINVDNHYDSKYFLSNKIIKIVIGPRNDVV